MLSGTVNKHVRDERLRPLPPCIITVLGAGAEALLEREDEDGLLLRIGPAERAVLQPHGQTFGREGFAHFQLEPAVVAISLFFHQERAAGERAYPALVTTLAAVSMGRVTGEHHIGD